METSNEEAWMKGRENIPYMKYRNTDGRSNSRSGIASALMGHNRPGLFVHKRKREISLAE